LSVNVPVAVNGCMVPAAMLCAGGVTAIDTRFAPLTTSVVDVLIPFRLALSVTEPERMACISPVGRAVAMAVLDELHRTWVVTSAWRLSL
jgi:hypothetical protein